MDTLDANSKVGAKPKKEPLVYPRERPWVEFVVIIVLAAVSCVSMIGLVIESNEAKLARIVAVSRLEVIYRDLMKSESELKELKVQSIEEERTFHRKLDESMRAHNVLLKRIATKLDVPVGEVDEILAKDPNR